MSIIHDALKKVQHSLERKHGRHPPEPQTYQSSTYIPPARPQNTPVSPLAVKKEGVSAKMIFIMVNTILIAAGIIIVLLLRLLETQTPRQDTSALVRQRLEAVIAPGQAATAPAPQASALATPLPQATDPIRPSGPPPLELNGTMLMDERRVALINNDIYELSEYVDGKRITDISLTEATLLDEATGATIILRVRNRR
jgi:hypothetical protein